MNCLHFPKEILLNQPAFPYALPRKQDQGPARGQIFMTDHDLRPRLISLADGSEVILPETAIIGRKPESTVALPDSRVSRRHSMIRRQEDDEFWFYDLGSFNGSYINNERVTTTRQLEPGDVIRICDFEYRFELPQAERSPKSDAQDMQVVPMIILVSDIKGFTRLSEILPPDELAQVIGSWYSYCDQVLTEHGAAIDKFIGDAVLAYWTDVSPNARQWALSAARYLRESCSLIQEEMKWTFERYGVEFSSGVALHLGEVSWGQLGQGGLTMLGDAVNTTFRIQALTRQLGSDILVSSDFLQGWPEGSKHVRSLGTHALKGKENPVDIYALESAPELFVR